jgi:hypothetical protein
VVFAKRGEQSEAAHTHIEVANAVSRDTDRGSKRTMREVDVVCMT